MKKYDVVVGDIIISVNCSSRNRFSPYYINIATIGYNHQRLKTKQNDGTAANTRPTKEKKKQKGD
jgi:hypothetical protein